MYPLFIPASSFYVLVSRNYHLKAIAMLQSPWREVLFLDSDNVCPTYIHLLAFNPATFKRCVTHANTFQIPTRDPEYIFEAPPYKRLGVMVRGPWCLAEFTLGHYWTKAHTEVLPGTPWLIVVSDSFGLITGRRTPSILSGN